MLKTNTNIVKTSVVPGTGTTSLEDVRWLSRTSPNHAQDNGTKQYNKKLHSSPKTQIRWLSDNKPGLRKKADTSLQLSNKKLTSG